MTIRNVLLNGDIDLDKISVILCTLSFFQIGVFAGLEYGSSPFLFSEEITVTTQSEYDEVTIKNCS